MRLQCTNFICAITPLLGEFGTDAAAEIKQFTEFATKGFQNAKLTLDTSASCFISLCGDCAAVLNPFAEQLVQQILGPDFIGTWTFQDNYRDIVRGFSYLVDSVSKTDMLRCATLVPLVVRPLLIPLNTAIMEVKER